MHEKRWIISLVLLSSVGDIKTKANAQHCQRIPRKGNALAEDGSKKRVFLILYDAEPRWNHPRHRMTSIFDCPVPLIKGTHMWCVLHATQSLNSINKWNKRHAIRFPSYVCSIVPVRSLRVVVPHQVQTRQKSVWSLTGLNFNFELDYGIIDDGTRFNMKLVMSWTM